MQPTNWTVAANPGAGKHQTIADAQRQMQQAVHEARRQTGLWLAAVALAIIGLIVIGGLTRLTNSGLSITEWQPILGVIPPLGEAAWAEAFAKYQEIPQYKLVTTGIGLDEFKTLYWWEWTHRLAGRLVGLIFLLPAVVLAVQGKLERELWPRLITIFVLGGLQGVLGWWMVQSGLSERVSVSQYRLAAHLALAVLLYGAVLWTSFHLLDRGLPARWPQRRLNPYVWLLIGLVYLQMLLGALTAGLRAGLIENDWPLMDGAWVPDGLFGNWLAMFEDPRTVQFDHRMGAYAIVLSIVLLWFALTRRDGESFVSRRAGLVLVAALVQLGLGVWTLLAVVPIPLAALHQFGALMLLSALLWLAHGMGRHA